MVKRRHEVRDALHDFIEFDEHEKRVIDSAPFQRLRHIHQLALSSLVYPGASHKRFEHSLGVMEIAGRIFDTITRPDKLNDAVREVVPEPGSVEFAYSRSILRMAALCHDIGHLPFSHAAEEALLPGDWDHERITYELICSEEMEAVWGEMSPSPKPEDVAKLALGPRKVEKLRLELAFNTWEAILAEIIVDDIFGADRIDYLLRDSLHTGVAYGRFDRHRLIQTMRILPRPPSSEDESGDGDVEPPEPALGIEKGGLESAEGLLLARYFMFAQVYYHPTRLIYDQHLKDFLASWLETGKFPTDPMAHLSFTDNEVMAAILDAAKKNESPGHDPARRIVERDHFRVVDERRAGDVGLAVRAVHQALADKYGDDVVRYGASPRGGGPADFPVMERDGSSASSLSLSEVMERFPVSRDEYVFISSELRSEASSWLGKKRERIVGEAMDKEREEQEGSK